ncbi:MAG: hypothetical protein ABIK51_00350 [candidate division WOR-3 bacterium]
MNKTMPSNQQRAICPQCGIAEETFALYEHPGCPSAPTGVNTWKTEAWLGPDGRPINLPCPDCQDGLAHPPSYLFCEQCKHQWVL